jgi:hypothetical protein
VHDRPRQLRRFDGNVIGCYSARAHACLRIVELRILAHAESLGIAVEHEPFTRDQFDFQETPISIQPLSRNPVDEGMTFHG